MDPIVVSVSFGVSGSPKTINKIVVNAVFEKKIDFLVENLVVVFSDVRFGPGCLC